MDKTAIIQKLSTYKISTKLVEQIIGIPFNNLSRWLKNPEKMPGKHAEKISKFLCDVELLRPDTTNIGTFIDSIIMSAIGSIQIITELEAEIAALKPAANSWNQRMAATAEALKRAPKSTVTTSVDLDEVRAEIKAIQSEKCPKERDTLMGRKSWQMDQQKRVDAIRKKYGI